MRRVLVLVAGLALALALLAGAWAWRQHQRDAASLTERVGAVAPLRGGETRPCRSAGARVLLALGQSNAGNHGGDDRGAPAERLATVTVFDGTGCRRAADPLPFATGSGRSIWSGLEAAWRERGAPTEVVLALLAVESTTIDDWVRKGSPLRERFESLLGELRRAGFSPDAVLWQQGESDARLGTSRAGYLTGLERLHELLRGGGVSAPLLIARSTRCRNGGGAEVRAAVEEFVSRHPDSRHGPDTDALAGADRIDDCHWSEAGLAHAARAWVAALDGAQGAVR